MLIRCAPLCLCVQWGRSLPFDNYVLQLMPDGETRVLTPLGLGSTPVLPIPGWSEREYKAEYLSKTSDRIAFSLSVVTQVYLFGWLVCLLAHWHHPLVRVSDPLFSALSLVGLQFLASSNFITFHQTDQSCRAFMGLFALGLTLSFAPLVLKNLRIWSLWHNTASFAPAPIKQWHMFCALCALLLIDGAVHLAWVLDGSLRAVRHTPDPYRPSEDYFQCDYFSRHWYVVIVVWKAACLAAAMYLAYLLRNVSSTFSESRFIALCVYNCSIVLSVGVPMTATSAAGRDTYLVGDYLLIFLCCSTASIMCVPKLLAIRNAAPITGQPNRSWSKSQHTQVEQSPSPVAGLPLPPPPPPPDSGRPPGAAGAGAGDLIAKPLPAASSVVHSVHFPGSAPVVPVAGSPPAAATAAASAGSAGAAGAASRQSHWTRADAVSALVLPFQSMLGLSQVERRADSRYTDDESGVHRSHASESARWPTLAAPTNERRLPGVELSSPTPLLQSSHITLTPIPQSPVESLPSGSSSPLLLRATMDLLSELPSTELEQIHSSLLRRRQVTPSHAQSHSHHSIHYQYHQPSSHMPHSRHSISAHSHSDHSTHSAGSAHSSASATHTSARAMGPLASPSDGSGPRRPPLESPASQTVLGPPSPVETASGPGSLPLSSVGSDSAAAPVIAPLPRTSYSSMQLAQLSSGAEREFAHSDDLDQTIVSFHSDETEAF